MTRDVDVNRIANAATEPVIEITEEMMEAGVAVFRKRDAFDAFDSSTLEWILYEVYEAMSKLDS
jgi:hypothetical protein